jgi:hypothetical protein
MAIPDRELLFKAMAKLIEQRDIVIPKPGPLFTELMDFHSTGNDRVSIPRQRQWEREQFSVDLSQLENIPVTAGRSFDYYVIDDPIPTLTLEHLRSAQQALMNVGNYIPQFIGDQTCSNNANSAHLRCAVNPCGPCERCQDYQPGVGGGGGAL